MKAVISSDWHPDVSTHGVPRFKDVRDAVHATVDRAIEEGAGLYLFAGDLCDPDAGSVVFRCVELAIEAALRLQEAEIHSVWIAGNHDVIEDGSGDTTLSPMRALSLQSSYVQVYERPGEYRFSAMSRTKGSMHCGIVCLPFTATSHPYNVGGYLDSIPEADIVLAHLNVPGVIPGEETTEMPRGREVVLPVDKAKKKAKWVINGHYHRQQRTDDGVWIPGSLARLTFGEEWNDPSFLVLDLEV